MRELVWKLDSLEKINRTSPDTTLVRPAHRCQSTEPNSYLYRRMSKTYLKYILTFIIFFLVTGPGYTQMKLLKKLFSNEKDTTRSSSFLALPVIGYSQETGAEFGAVSLYSFYTDKDTLTRTSRITGVATFTTKSQSNFQLKTDIWAPGNRYHYTTEFRHKNFPFNFYGTGSNTLESNKDRITQKFFRLNAAAEKAFGKLFYTGLIINYESHRFSDKETGGIFSTHPTLQDKDGGKVFLLGITQVIDSRNSNTYTTKGTYLKLSYSYAPDFFGGANFNGSTFRTDFRSFKSLDKKFVIGLNGTFQAINGENTPFYLFPQLGNDEIMRGYYTGRYRDENLLAIQSEIRFRFHPRFGIIGFAGTGTVYNNRDFRIADLKPSLGGGVRYFFDIERGLSVRMDYGIGEKRSGEDRQKGFYLSLGESF